MDLKLDCLQLKDNLSILMCLACNGGLITKVCCKQTGYDLAYQIWAKTLMETFQHIFFRCPRFHPFGAIGVFVVGNSLH